MSVKVTKLAEKIFTVKTISLYYMHAFYHMTPNDITREGLGEEVRALLSGGHVNELNRLRWHHHGSSGT